MKICIQVIETGYGGSVSGYVKHLSKVPALSQAVQPAYQVESWPDSPVIFHILMTHAHVYL